MNKHAELNTPTPKTRERLGGLSKFAAVAAIGGMALAGCAPTEAQPKPTPTSTSSVETPEPTPTPVETEAPVANPYEFNIAQADVQHLIDMRLPDLAQQPVEQRLLLALYYSQGQNSGPAGYDTMREYGEDFFAVSKNPLDKVPDTISVDNSPEEIHRLALTMIRMPWSQVTSNGVSLDVDAAKHMLLGIYVDGAAAERYGPMVQFADDIVTHNGGRGINGPAMAAANGKFFPQSLSVEGSELFTDAAGLPCRTLTITEPDVTGENETHTFTRDYCFVTASNGSSMWLSR